MQINIPDPVSQTILFIAALLAALALTFRSNPGWYKMTRSHTDELKGLAILMVIFSHAGYFLSNDTRFLYPLSVAGGVGVNIFLFLSGFGLTASALKSEFSITSFYKRRLKKLYLPMWGVLIVLLGLDFLLLGKTYAGSTIVQSFLGIFVTDDIFTSINSPLWYFTLILFYYLTFPLVFRQKKAFLSAGAILLLGILVTNLNLPVNPDLIGVNTDVLKMYKLHYLAFPLGMGFAVFLNGNSLESLIKKIAPVLRWVLTAFLIVIVGYTAIHSGVGEGVKKEQLVSLVTVVSLVFITLLQRFQFGLLILFGVYSYEIYLIQWPLMYRYDLLYKHLPASLATLSYLVVYIILGFGLNKLVNRLLTSASPMVSK